MANCNLTQGVGGKKCKYSLSGLAAAYLANFHPPVEGDTAVANAIAYKFNADGSIDDIVLPTGEMFYPLDCSSDTLSFTDQLLVGGSGGKYRQHTLNGVVPARDLDVIGQGDAISLGRFIAVAVDKEGKISVLGRTGGLAAPANGFDYASGAASADATGWTLLLQGDSFEIAPIVKDISVITPIYTEVVTP